MAPIEARKYVNNWLWKAPDHKNHYTGAWRSEQITSMAHMLTDFANGQNNNKKCQAKGHEWHSIEELRCLRCGERWAD